MAMKSILLIGLGTFGMHIASELSEVKCEVMAVDIDEKKVDAALPLVNAAQIGDSTDEVFLSSLGVDNYDVCIVTIGESFQDSLETASLLKDLGAKKVVSRVDSDVHAKFLLRNGADEVLYPEKQLASWAAVRYSSEHVLDYIELDDDHAIFEVTVPESWVGKTVGQLDVRKSHNINILGVKQNGELKLTITPDTMFGAQETLLVLGTNKAVQKCFRI